MNYVLTATPDPFTNPDNFFGSIILCNNGTTPIQGGYSFDVVWPSLQEMTSGITAIQNGASNCDTYTLTTADWHNIDPGNCITISINGTYTPPLIVPADGIGVDGSIVTTVFDDPNTYYPEAYNSVPWEFYFDENCFIYCPGEIKIGEAQLKEWGATTDMVVPDNKIEYAISSVHSWSLFNNLVGDEITSMNYAFAQSLIESHCGCEDDMIITDSNALDFPLQFEAASTGAGCFQITPTGFAQLGQFYPDVFAPMDYNNISGGNFAKANIGKAFYDFSSFIYWEKILCWDPIGFFSNSSDLYAAESIIAFPYHDGLGGAQAALEEVFVNQRDTFLNQGNTIQYLFDNVSTAPGIEYGKRMRNNLIQLEDNFGVFGGACIDAPNWDPSVHEWYGWYNELCSWTDMELYIDKVSPIFPTANIIEVKNKTQEAFNLINAGNPVNFMAIGPAIDAMVLAFPAYHPDKGLGETYQATVCGSPNISMTTCDTICVGEVAELLINFMGTPPFNASIEGPFGEIYSIGPTNASPYILEVTNPGIYKVLSFSDSGGTVALNCHYSSAEVLSNGLDAVTIPNMEQCDDVFDLELNDVLQPAGTLVSYYDSLANAQAAIATGLLASPYTITTAMSPFEVFCRVEDPVTGCVDIVVFYLIIGTESNAGEDGDLQICDDSTDTIDLFGLITGEDSGGVWTQTSGTGGVFDAGSGTYTPTAGSTTSTFEYTIVGIAPCVDDVSIATISTDARPVLTFVSTTCSVDMSTYDVDFTVTPANALITTTEGTVVGNVITGISDGSNVTITATNLLNNSCEDTMVVNAPDCSCPTVDTPITPNNPTICFGTTTPDLSVTLPVAPSIGDSVNWYDVQTGGAILGTGLTYTTGITAAGTYVFYAEAEESASSCVSNRIEVMLTIASPSNAGEDGIVTLCDNSSEEVDLFNTLGGMPDSGGIWYPTLNSGTNIFNPNVDSPGIYTYTVNEVSPCSDDSAQVNVIIQESVIANQDLYAVCDDNEEIDNDTTNDSAIFNLPSRNNIILGTSQIPADYSVTYYLSQVDANNNVDQIANDYQNITNPQIIYARVENNETFCYAIAPVTLMVHPLPIVNIDEEYIICINNNGEVILPTPIIDTGLTTVNYSFEWYLNGVITPLESNGSINPNSAGNYSVLITNNITGCISNIDFIVVESSFPVLEIQQVSITFIEDNAILATAINNNSEMFFEFNLDNGPWISNSLNNNTFLFENVSAGVHTIGLRDINGCSETSEQIIILDFIPYFTPNGDGYHDTWNIIGIENQPDAVIYIFNRYGKLLKRLSPVGLGWDGKYNNAVLPSDDYWFSLDYKNPNTNQIKTFKSHFTLKH